MSNLILGDIDISPLLNAKKILDDGIKSADSDLEKTGTIKSFEFCFELTWKILTRILTKRGLTTTSPRDVFRIAADNSLIDNPEFWFDAIEKRNLVSHTYKEETAKEVLDFLPKFQTELNKIVHTLINLKW